jgi:hypothetical protein
MAALPPSAANAGIDVSPKDHHAREAGGSFGVF